MDSKKELAGLQIDIDSIPDQNTRIIIRHLLNIIERQAEKIKERRAENQKLRDENNHLKGEQGQPRIRKQSQTNKDHSSESERKGRSGKKPRNKKKSKKKKLTVHKTERRFVDRSQLPEDAVFKGHHST